ncbi:MAG: hypothetical protein Harvfovirus1_72 [Harvfovirus sp.]|uniref:SEC-C motif-containing protein n=1 Tax=Harvfovirus sp. TaxID=2487768 RepID=A0A3G4ZZU6_9VIRU|nr:MAG: hypothetical protein Harvfovirus1_72 [Harvfovirus sp.]
MKRNQKCDCGSSRKFKKCCGSNKSNKLPEAIIPGIIRDGSVVVEQDLREKYKFNDEHNVNNYIDRILFWFKEASIKNYSPLDNLHKMQICEKEASELVERAEARNMVKDIVSGIVKSYEGRYYLNRTALNILEKNGFNLSSSQ